MSASTTEIEEFQQFLSGEYSNGSAPDSLEAALEKFRQLQKLRAELAEAEEESRQGLATPLDLDELNQELTERLAAEGTTD